MEKPGTRIRNRRKELGLNQTELAGKVGVHQSTISDIENGADFSADLLMRIAHHLQTTPTYLMKAVKDSPWPFARIQRDRILVLDPERLAYVEGATAKALTDVEGPTPEDIEAFRGAHIRPAKKRPKRGAA